MKKKKTVFNKKGMIIYFILAFTSIILMAVDSASMSVFITTKIIALAIIGMLVLLSRFIPSKYLED